MRIRAPHGASVEISSASADVEGRGRYGKVEVNSASGDVTFEEIEGGGQGTASAMLIGRLVGNGKVRSASGDVEIGAAGGSLKVQTASGDQEIGSVASGEVTLQTASGEHQRRRQARLQAVDRRALDERRDQFGARGRRVLPRPVRARSSRSALPQ